MYKGATCTNKSTKRRYIDNYCVVSWPDLLVFIAAGVSGRICKCVNLQNVHIFFISSKLHCASLIFSLHRHDFVDRLRLLLVQCDYQNGGCSVGVFA